MSINKTRGFLYWLAKMPVAELFRMAQLTSVKLTTVTAKDLEHMDEGLLEEDHPTSYDELEEEDHFTSYDEMKMHEDES